MSRKPLIAAAAVMLLWSCQASAMELAAHKAEYRLTLENDRGGNVSSGHGAMSYEVIDACDGWAVRQRLEMVLTNRDGQDVDMVSDYTTYESKDGLSMRFRMHQSTDLATTDNIEGEATLERLGGAGTVSFTLPEPARKPLVAGTLFPTAHTEAILTAAQQGKKFLTLPLFDGTSSNGAEDSTIVINGWPSPPNEATISSFATDAASPLATLPSGHVHVAFFERGGDNQQPNYEVGMRYWANGVADAMSMDFGDFIMGATLTKLTMIKPGC